MTSVHRQSVWLTVDSILIIARVDQEPTGESTAQETQKHKISSSSDFPASSSELCVEFAIV